MGVDTIPARSSMTLFPDQQEAFERVCQLCQQKPSGGRALVVAPTAWGKTVFFSFLIAWWRASQETAVLIIAHRDELLDQAREKVQAIDPTAIVGKVGSGIHEYGAPITVASIDTIRQAPHLKDLPRFGYGLVIVDEAHHAPAPKYRKVLQALASAFHLGVTATPTRLDGKSLEPQFGPPVFSMSVVEAITRGRLCNVRAIAIRTETALDAVKTAKNTDGEMDFKQQDLEKAIDTPARNRRIVEAYQEHTPGQRAICFGVTVEHAMHMAQAFESAGIPSALICGETPTSERKRLYRAFHEGAVLVLTTVMVLTEGFDQPRIECIILARPTLSPVVFLQSLGRGLRVSEGKTICTVLDLTDTCDAFKHTLAGPQTVEKALGLPLKNGETVLDALKREELARREDALRSQQVRKLKRTRTTDVPIDLFATVTGQNWQYHEEGDSYTLEVGQSRHRVDLLPMPDEEEAFYALVIRLAPDFVSQTCLKRVPAAWCRLYAERQEWLRRQPEKHSLLDRSAPWRQQEMAPESAQARKLANFGLTNWRGLTKGDVSDILSICFAAEQAKGQYAWQAKKTSKHA